MPERPCVPRARKNRAFSLSLAMGHPRWGRTGCLAGPGHDAQYYSWKLIGTMRWAARPMSYTLCHTQIPVPGP